jgi:hypothetical protein
MEVIHVPLANTSVIHCGLRRDKYYEFKLNASFQLTNSNLYHLKKLSHLFYFGQQVPARITWAPLSLTYNVGETMVLPCKVDGFPRPEVFWGRTLTDSHRLGSANRGPYTGYKPFYHVETLSNVVLGNDGYYLCFARNKIVNPPMGVRIMEDTWHMRVFVK